MVMKATILMSCCLTVVLVLTGCGGKEQTTDKVGVTAIDEPEKIVVQHILIAFEGTLSGKTVNRSQEEAEKLAMELLERARGGEDFDKMVEQYTDDSAPGIYGMVNHGYEADPERQVYARSEMVPAFGDVGFSLAVDEIGIAHYDKKKSKYGWHIIKRLR
jgi:hypothetical protein